VDVPGTREQLLIVAERLFARQGTAAVSLRAIAREAGQRNTGAVHYHFGSREGVIAAIFELRASVIDHARRQMLDQIPEGLEGRERIRAIMAAIVVPFARQPGPAEGENHYARFVAQLMQADDVKAHQIWRSRFSASIERSYALLARALPDLPKAVFDHRFATAFKLAIYAIADLEHQFVGAQPPEAGLAQLRLQIENIIDMLAAAVATEPCVSVAAAVESGSLRRPTNPSSLSAVLGAQPEPPA
jgi:AcrR family transcriptional regulator